MISQIRYFPEMFTNLYASAEVSGKHDETLQRLRVYFEEEGFNALQFFARVMNGIIYGCITALIVFNIIRFWVNYYGAMMKSLQ